MAQFNEKPDRRLFEHPKLSAAISHVKDEFSSYKYTIYRCASKMVTLQKLLYTSTIPYKLVLAVLNRHNISSTDNNCMVPPFQLTAMIQDIYFACEKLGHFTKSVAYNLGTATAVLADLFWNVFDPFRRHSISPIEIKTTLLLLCKLQSPGHLAVEFFQIVCNAKGYVTKYSLEYLLRSISKILTYIGEGPSYGEHNVPMILEQCFARCNSANGVTEYQFHCIWSSYETRFLIYSNLIALIKRIEDTEKLIHNNVCAACLSEKIIGVRFKCQSCKNLSLCLKCFATGYASNKHETGHRMYEVFTEDLPPKKLSHFIAKLCSLFFQGSQEETTGFCNSNESSVTNETELITISTRLPTAQIKPESSSKTCHSLGQSFTGSTGSSLHTFNRLQSIIDKLMEQNAKIEMQLKCLHTLTTAEISNFLNSHQQFLIDIINEMRNFTKSGCSYPTSSTPNRPNICNGAAQGFLPQNLSRSLYGAELNRSYLEANRTYSLSDLSEWLSHKKMSTPYSVPVLSVVNEDDSIDHSMIDFKALLQKVKEIVEDSYSDNTELAEATQNLENVLDSIIRSEERRIRDRV